MFRVKFWKNYETVAEGRMESGGGGHMIGRNYARRSDVTFGDVD